MLNARNIEHMKAFLLFYCSVEKSFSEVLQGVLVAEDMCLSLRFVLNLPATEFNVNRGKCV
jgi:hypothetical protein